MSICREWAGAVREHEEDLRCSGTLGRSAPEVFAMIKPGQRR
ncbi:hypothetical protein [Streptomyces anulatus]|nr:hypothetical protein [Streptomyces anulatus]WIY76618.1 hypothetical protein QPM16_13625 [Streptomyces anulatus]